MSTHIRSSIVGVAIALAATAASAGEVKIQLRDGHVTLMAENATVREILAEWSRVGQTVIVNADKLSGPPVTVQFQDVPEKEALQSLLRKANGYILASRATPIPGASTIERILVYPIAPLAAAATSSTPVPRPADVSGQPFGRGRNTPGGVDDESLIGAPRMMGGPGGQGPGGPGQGAMRGGQGNVVGGRPPEVTFDYANPMQIRQALEQATGGNVAVGGVVSVSDGQTQTITVSPYGTPLVNPYTGQPVMTPVQETTPALTPGGSAGGTATRPGMMVPVPGQTQQGTSQNPYGLPSGVRPGTVVSPPVEPDRSKYTNPPRPPATTTTTGGGRGGR